MTAKERLERIKTIIKNGGVYRDYTDSTQAFNADISEVEQALIELEELKRDVKRYFELRSLPDDKYTTEVSRECVRLELKLWKVGKEE